MYALRRRGGKAYTFVRSLDIFNLRFWLPDVFRDRMSRRLGVEWGPDGIDSSEDFMIDQTQYAQALCLIAVCRRPK